MDSGDLPSADYQESAAAIREAAQGSAAPVITWQSVGVVGVMWVEALREADPDVYRALESEGRLVRLAKRADRRIDREYQGRRNLLLRTRAGRPSPVELVISLLAQAREHALSIVLPHKHEGPAIHAGGWELVAAKRLVSMVSKHRIAEHPNVFQAFPERPELAWLVMELDADWQSRQSLHQTFERIAAERANRNG